MAVTEQARSIRKREPRRSPYDIELEHDDGHGAIEVVEADTPTWRANCRCLVPAIHHRVPHVVLIMGVWINCSSMVRVERDGQHEHTIYTGSGRNMRNTLRPVCGGWY